MRGAVLLGLLGFLALALSGCGPGPGALTAGFFGSGTEQGSGSSSGLFGGLGGLGGTPAEDNPTRTAKVDKAPPGTFERPEKGALAGRNYAHTTLNPEKARDLVNQYRRSKGLKPLTLRAELSGAAKEHSRDLARFDRISHYGSDGSTPWDRVVRAGYKPRLAAENVGTGQASFEEVLAGWEKSPSHNKNLLTRDAEHMGVALVQDPNTGFKTFWTLVIASPM